MSKIFMYKKGLWIYNCRWHSKEYQEKVIYNKFSVTINLCSEGVCFEEYDIDVKFELHEKLKQCCPAGQTEQTTEAFTEINNINSCWHQC